MRIALPKDYLRRLLRFINKSMGSLVILPFYLFGEFKKHISISKKPESSNKKLEKILVIKIVGLGDTVLMLPSIRSLKEIYPKTKISALVTPLSSGIIAKQPLIDEIILYDIFGKHKGIIGFLKIVSNLRRKKFDVVVDYEQHIKLITIVSFLTGAQRRIGFDNSIIRRGRLLTDKVVLRGDKHMVESFDDLLRPLINNIKTDKLVRIRVSVEDKKYIKNWLETRGVRRDDLLVGIHVGSGATATSRRWPEERFAEIADRVVRKFAAKVILTGSLEESQLVKDVAQLMKKSCLIAAGHTSIKQLVALIDRFDLFISNDTGPMHIGPAMGTPTIGLFGPNNPERYRPFGLQHIAIYKKVDCSPCINIHNGEISDCKNPKCMKCITVDDVWTCVENQVRKLEK